MLVDFSNDMPNCLSKRMAACPHRYVFALIITLKWKVVESWDFNYRFSRKHFYELGQVSKSSKRISLQFKTPLNSL